MKDLFIPYEFALEMKQLGFDELCFSMWTKGLSEFEYGDMMLPRIYSSGFRLDDTQSCKGYVNNHNNGFGISAPLYSQCFDWFRKEHNLICWIASKTVEGGNTVYIPNGRTIPDTIKNNLVVDIIPYYSAKTYEEAQLACLTKLIELVKE